ncbi:ATP-dependent RecD-like DNA helicase [Liquorilactobacillus mali]|uniref:ATP-dependent RecD2 DNA helicase n=1 Tax=Liquorilactobacillus mali TaxID=1618 RepID=A0A0R2G0H2_9LACO|nr:ATP-dependent RecD-like DNA helicase [Liquorilactobacillus mali]KRN34335.1 exonuclease V subunit alpha [Liquorilactobacillus mali]MDN7144490.1 ATP-dependent RecD-like DNA helicase [Liquorilactobacillus mali]
MSQLDLLDTNDETEKYIIGSVDAIFFESPETFYKVIQVKIAQTNLNWSEKEIVATGSFADINEGVEYHFVGKLVTHPRYGQQFQVFNYQNEMPSSKSGLIAYLSSDAFAGIGEKTATKIVETLGMDAIAQIIADEKKVKKLGLSKKQQETLVENLRANNGTQQIIIELNGFGFGSQMAAAIYNRYREKTVEVIHEDPYRLAREIPGIGFKRADQIAEKMGLAADTPQRIKAGLLQGIYDICQEKGNTYTNAEQLLNQTMVLLSNSRRVELSPELLADQLLELANDGVVVGEENRIYLRKYYESEWRIAERIKEIKETKINVGNDFDDDFKHLIAKVEEQLGIKYGVDQIEAIKEALQSKVYLLTGGPGTGKTTIINGIVAIYAALKDISLDINEYKNEQFPILLAAPTGRASKRMNETTGLPASTIHRLLGLGSGDEDDSEHNQLEGSLLIVDEMSMVDTGLFDILMDAIPKNMQVILVGDKDQLPSVGPGQVFADLLASPDLPKIELKAIYRQENESSIITLAHAIKDGTLPADIKEGKRDRSFIECNSYQIENVVRQVVERAKAKGFKTRDFQVLAPMYRGPAGIDKLNEMLQEILNPHITGKKQVEFNKQHFRIGDKVLHLVNAPENNIFNGDLGEIVGIVTSKESKDHQESLIIDFDDNEVEFKRKDWIKIRLAYCISIHKAQGSEFKMVILPMVQQYTRMLNRNLLYTAVTRARDFLILLGEPSAYMSSVNRVAINRETTLIQRLAATFNPPAADNDNAEKAANISEKREAYESDTILTTGLINSGKIDPMIGMGEITPSSF